MMKRTILLRRFVPGKRRQKQPRRERTILSCPAYRAWLRTLPCLVPGCPNRSTVAHTGPHGYASKASDFQAVPLCFEHHLWEFPASYHRLGRAEFERQHGVTIADAIVELNRAWFRLRKGAA